MRLHATLLAAALAAGCASVTTRVVELNPAVRHAPTERVEILLEPPARPYTRIAIVEAEGVFGASELELLEDMRKRARELGADAIIRTESQRWYQPPVAVYDPLYDPFFFPRRYHPYRPYWPPYSGYRLAGGGYYYTAQAVAIKYQPVSEAAPVPAPAVPEKPERPES